MTLDVYINADPFDKAGTLTITSDRITSFSILVDKGRKTLSIEDVLADPNFYEKVTDYQEFSSDKSQFPFSSTRLSKGDIAYRHSKLTHKISSAQLNDFVGKQCEFLFKPTFFQRLFLSYNLKKLYWQTEDFKKHLFEYIIFAIIGGFITFGITRLTDKPCPENSNDNRNDSISTVSKMNPMQTNNPTLQHDQLPRESETSENVLSVPYSKDTAQQNDTTHKLK